MGLPVITFAVVLTGSFALLLGALATGTASKSTRLRIDAIRFSPHADGPSLEMKLRHSHLRAMRLNVVLDRLRVRNKLETLLLQTGFAMSAGGCALACSFAAAGLAAVVLAVTGSAPAALSAAPIGGAAPIAWLVIQRRRRVRAFNAALSDAIDLLARALRAGHSVGSAIEMVGEQSPQPLGAEFMQVFQEQRLGLPFRDALEQMGERIPSRDLSFLVTAILIQKETGGDLTEVLDRTAHVIRERVRIEGEVRTRTAQGRLTGWILSLLPVVMLALLNFINPGYSDLLFHDPSGRYWLYAGAGLIAVGALIIRKIVDVRV